MLFEIAKQTAVTVLLRRKSLSNVHPRFEHRDSFPSLGESVESFNSLREKQSHGSERIRYNTRNAYLHTRQILNISVDTNGKLNQNVLLALKLDIFSTADAETRRVGVNHCFPTMFLRKRTDTFWKRTDTLGSILERRGQNLNLKSYY